MRTNMKFWPAKRLLCLVLCILMLIGIAMPSMDAFTRAGRESLLGSRVNDATMRLLGITEAKADNTQRVTYIAEHDLFSNGTTQNVVEYSEPSNRAVARYSHTPNLSNSGQKLSDFEAGIEYSDTVTIPGAEELQVTVRMSGNYDTYFAALDGEDTTICSLDGFAWDDNGDETQHNQQFTVSGNTVKFTFENNSDELEDYYVENGLCYGYFAIVEATVPMRDIVSGSYEDPTSNSVDWTNLGRWNTAADGSGETIDPSQLAYMNGDLTLYAEYAPTITCTYKANGGTFSNGSDTNTVIYSAWIPDKTITRRVSHTSNVDDDGNMLCELENSEPAKTEVIRIPGAESLTVDVMYGGDWWDNPNLDILEGNYPDYDSTKNDPVLYSISLTGDDYKHTHETYTIQGDTVTLYFDGNIVRNNSCEGYGYYAVITGNGKRQEVVEGAYEVPTNEAGAFCGWNSTSDGTGEPIVVDDSEMIAQDRECYATWEPYKKVIFKAGDGSFSDGTDTKVVYFATDSSNKVRLTDTFRTQNIDESGVAKEGETYKASYQTAGTDTKTIYFPGANELTVTYKYGLYGSDALDIRTGYKNGSSTQIAGGRSEGSGQRVSEHCDTAWVTLKMYAHSWGSLNGYYGAYVKVEAVFDGLSDVYSQYEEPSANLKYHIFDKWVYYDEDGIKHSISPDELSVALDGRTLYATYKSSLEHWHDIAGCQWTVDPDGCLWIQPKGDLSTGVLYGGDSTSPWSNINCAECGPVKSIYVKPGVYISGSASHLFEGLKSLKSANLANLNTEQATSLNSMFADCSALTDIDLSGWDTRNVTDMSNMFDGCSSLTSLDVSGWDTSNAANMGGMFDGCGSLNEITLGEDFAFNGALLPTPGFNTTGKWILSGDETGSTAMTPEEMRDAGTVTAGTWTWQMFDGSGENLVEEWNTCGDCEWGIDPDGCLWIRPVNGISGTLDEWDESPPWYFDRDLIRYVVIKPGVRTEIGYHMFYYLNNCMWMDLSGLVTSSATNMTEMFCGCSSLTSLDVSRLDTSSVIRMDGMFYNCSSLTSLDVSSFDTSNVTGMSMMFSGCSKLTSLDLSSFDTSNVTHMGYMFNNCSSLTNLDVSGFDTSNVTNMSYMFYNCDSLTSLDVSGFDTSKVTYMGGMFHDCSSLTSLDISGFNTSKVTDMSSMFFFCEKLISLDVSSFDTSKVTNMNLMFDNCSSLTSLDVSGFDTDNVEYMNSMFSGCSSLTSLDVSGFDTGNVEYMGSMFSDCSALTSLDVSGFDTSNVTSMYEMFRNCSSLTSLDLSNFDTSKVTNMRSMFDGCSSLTSLDVSGFDTSNVTSMNYMFSVCSSLTSLDVSSFDTSNVTNMFYMFYNCPALNTVKLGENFTFNGKNISLPLDKALLPTPPAATTTGKWILEDDVDGGSAMTPEQMRDAGTVPAGTWVWQEKPIKYTVIYHYNDGTGSTNTEKYVAAEAATLSSTYPARFNKTVTSWNTAEDGTGTSYELGATIPANTYAIGDVIDLYAIWEDNTSFTNVSEGVYQFQIPGNAQIKLDGLPAGTVYRVSEMLPNGWILVNQSNSSGCIGPLTNSVSTFINKYMPESASAAIYATKTMDGAPATEDMAFEFTLKEGDNVIQTVTAANGAVLFDPIIYTSAGTHVYTIVENWETYSGPLDASGVTFDTHVETVIVEVTDDGEGKLSAEVTYDADGPAFANRTNPGDLIITKNVIGQTPANADDTFTFTIRIKSPTGGDINSASVEIGKLPTAEQSPEPTP